MKRYLFLSVCISFVTFAMGSEHPEEVREYLEKIESEMQQRPPVIQPPIDVHSDEFREGLAGIMAREAINDAIIAGKMVLKPINKTSTSNEQKS